MRLVLFCHSLLSDWNHGNAHFLRGVVTELVTRGHEVRVYEPQDAWSVQNLVADAGEDAVFDALRVYPALDVHRYGPELDLAEAVRGADVVIVHEWNDPGLVAALGELRTKEPFVLLFHDTHHRSVSDEAAMARYDLRHYDAVLAFGRVIHDLYLQKGWAKRAFVWHEAADTRVFYPRTVRSLDWDLVWVGNWGDDERERELHEFLLEPVRRLGLKAAVFGVRYPKHALAALASSGIHYGGWVANYRVPELFARAKVTVHVPRGPYTKMLPGIPTIRPFEALACGIPLVSSPWSDAEHLFSPGEDFVYARTGDEMASCLEAIVSGRPELGAALARRGRRTIADRHSCVHRVDELLGIVARLRPSIAAASAPSFHEGALAS